MTETACSSGIVHGAGDFDMVLVQYNNVSVIDEKGENPAISGYDILLFISVFGVITAIYIKKKNNN